MSAITSELYANATLLIENLMPELYGKVRPELRLVHEAYFITQPEQMKR